MKKGFSLVELSIVLVILGLLVGGILAGQSLIRASELRAVGAEFSRYQTAAHAFRDKYFALPGDFRDATRFWGRLNANADCVTRSSAPVVTDGVCDGNGNSVLDTPAAANQSGDIFLFWLHLARAGIIEGGFTGLAGSGGTQHSMGGTNVPASKLASGIWSATYWDNSAASSGSFYAYNFGNFLSIGAPNSIGWGYNGLFKPEEAWNLDTKLDDGYSGRGKVMTNWSSCTLAANLNDFTAAYNLAGTGPSCVILFVKQL